MVGIIPKISYSLLASFGLKQDPVEALKKISSSAIDYIHYDVTNGPLFLKDIDNLRRFTQLPFDVHLTVENPIEAIEDLRLEQEDFFCIHVENNCTYSQLEKMKAQLNCHFGLAIKIDTAIENLSPFIPLIEYVLFMAATPGVSGGSFNDEVIDKIRTFHNLYPQIKVHVDGGINNTTSTLVRDVGVNVLISGSYILKDDNYSKQVSKLIGQNLNLPVSAMMHSGENLPKVGMDDAIKTVADEIDRKRIGCTVVTNKDNKFIGLITDTDIRKFLIRDSNLSNKKAIDIMNPHPYVSASEKPLIKLIRDLEKQGSFFTVVPVVDSNGFCLGIIRIQDVLFSEALGIRFRNPA
jgi:ribulose-phosphate 3-epimerase